MDKKLAKNNKLRYNNSVKELIKVSNRIFIGLVWLLT